MKLFVFVLGFVLISCSSVNKTKHSHKVTALETIDKFYREYLIINPKVKDLKFSRSFQLLIDKNQQLCSKQLPKIKCGWRVDGDTYLNAQEYDPKLTYKKAGLKLSEPVDGTVIVTLNVFPKHGRSYDRKISYKLVRENNDWVVEDIIRNKNQSSRDYILKENQQLN